MHKNFFQTKIEILKFFQNFFSKLIFCKRLIKIMICFEHKAKVQIFSFRVHFQALKKLETSLLNPKSSIHPKSFLIALPIVKMALNLQFCQRITQRLRSSETSRRHWDLWSLLGWRIVFERASKWISDQFGQNRAFRFFSKNFYTSFSAAGIVVIIDEFVYFPNFFSKELSIWRLISEIIWSNWHH